MTDNAPHTAAPRRRQLLVASGTFVLLMVLAPLVFDRHSVGSIDTAVKMAQATELWRSGFRSMALSYPGRPLDPTERFFPFESPFVFLSVGKWQSIFSSFYAVVAAWPLHQFGLYGLVGLAVIGGVWTTTSASRLPGSSVAAAMLVVAATPIWLYGLTPSETALALAGATAAIAAAMGPAGRAGDWSAGALLGVATLFRDESLLMAPGLLYARFQSGRSLRGLGEVVAAIGTPILLMGVVDQWWFERPMLAHLRHAVPGFDALLPRARARLPELAVMGWHERLVTVVEYWLLGFGLLAGAVLATAIAVAHAAGRRWPATIAAMVALLAVLHIIDLASLVREPRIVAGLFRLSPFLLLALLPRAAAAPASPLMKVAWVTAGCYMAIAALTVNTEGGKPTGPRLIIALWPLLAVAAIDVLSSYRAAARTSWSARTTALAGAVLVIGSVVMEAAVVVPARAARRADNAEAARLVKAIGDGVIVIDTIFDVEVLTSLHFDRAVMRVHNRQAREFAQAMTAQGVDRFTLIGRPPIRLTSFPGYRRAELWEPGRHIISRWVRDLPTSP